MVKTKLAEPQEVDVHPAVLYEQNSSTDMPDYIGIISDALILNPWDREIVRDGKSVFHYYVRAASLLWSIFKGILAGNN